MFVFIRRYGLDDPLGQLESMVVTHDFRILQKYVYTRRRAAILLFILFALIVCAFESWVASLFLAIVFVAGIWLLQHGLRYAASADSEFTYGYPRLRFPALARSARDRLAVRVYWYGTLNLRLLATQCAVWLLLILSAAASANPYRNEDLVALFTSTIFSPIAFGATQYLMERKRIFDRILTEACYLLDPKATPLRNAGRKYRGPIDDPLELQRPDIGDLIGVLSDAARILDARQVRGIAPHPVSTLLRAASQYLRDFLSNERSLGALVPDDLLDVLRSVVMVLVMPGEAASRQALLQHVKAFDGAGHPMVNLEGRPPSRLVVAANRTARAIAAIQPPIVNLATVVAIITALVLFILHKLNIIDTLHFMP